MKFPEPLQAVTFLRRYKRFLADVRLADGTIITVYCPNTGSMRTCLIPESKAMISEKISTTRKYPFTLEMLRIHETWVGINTSRTNTIVKEAIAGGRIKEIGLVATIIPEVKTRDGCRLDFQLSQNENKIFVEVKNCTMVENGKAMFPDAVTKRGTKHLEELLRLFLQGHQCIIFFCIQRNDAECFCPAEHIDPVYSQTLQKVVDQGVQVLAYTADVTPQEITLIKPLPIIFPSNA